jgi:hypothetical protein
MSDEVVIVEPIIPQITVVNQTPTVTVASPGPQGPAVDIFYVHNQGSPSAVWTINHNLGGQPTAVVLDSAGTQCEGTFSYPSNNQMVITFTAAFSGTAYVV